MNSSCMWGGDSAVTGLAGSGATGYGAAIYGAANAQTNDGMGSNHIKLADPAVVWKGGQRGGTISDIPSTSILTGTVTYTVDPSVSPTPGPITLDANSTIVVSNGVVTITPPAAGGGSRGGSMLGAAIVPAALLAANQLYKPSRALKNLSFGRKNGFKKTMKKFKR
jgi:hypothetical protein